MRRGLVYMAQVVVVLSLTACKPTVPKEYIQPDDMEDLLYDYHVAQGIHTEQGGDDAYNKNLYFEAILKKHGVTRADFDSSLVYYYTRADRFSEIYKRVQDRLADEALSLGASSGEVERFTSQSLSGDTTDVWEGNRHLMLMGNRPYHLYQFYQKADSSYHAGDSFLMTFNNTLLAPNGSRQTVVYLAVTYQNDSTITQNTTFSSTGTTTLTIPVCESSVKDIRGYIAMGFRHETDEQKEPAVMLLDHVRLIRLHHKGGEMTETRTAADSIREHKRDSILNDSVKPGIRRLGQRPQQQGVEAQKPAAGSQQPMDELQRRKMFGSGNGPVRTVKPFNKPNNKPFNNR